jgi:hypothetical protein
VLSWFNRRACIPPVGGGSNTTTTSTTTINVGGQAVLGLLNWKDEAVNVTIVAALNTTGQFCQFGIGIDQNNTSPANLLAAGAISYYSSGTGAAGLITAASAGGWQLLPEGLHVFWIALGAIPGGTAQVLNVSMTAMTRG